MATAAPHGKPGLSGPAKIGQVSRARRGVPVELDDFTDETKSLWPRLARAANLADRPVTFNPLHAIADARALRVVLAVDAGGRRLILKREGLQSGAHNDHFARSVFGQRAAHLRMAGNLQGLRVPAVLAFLPEEGAVLMERLGGASAATLIETAPDHESARAALAACGQWLGEFHRSSRGGRRPYQTRFVMDHFRAQSAAVADGRLSVAEPELYLKLTRAIEAMAGTFDGLPAQHAGRHGDYNLRNVLIDGSHTGAIDFGPDQTAPVGHDIARLLVDYVTIFGEHARIPPGQALKRKDLMTVLNAHDFAGPDDASVGFLVNTQLLAEWTKIPAQEEKRSLMQILRLRGLTETALRLFPALRAT